MSDYIVLKIGSSWQVAGRYTVADTDTAIRDAYTGPGFYAAFDLEDATVQQVDAQPKATPASVEEAEGG